MSQINVDNIKNRLGGAIGAPSGIVVTGVSTFSGDVSIGGTLTYEDVTNIDSVGIITARSDISIADKIIHTGDTNTAIRFPAADTFTVETAGSERLRIKSDGKFGFNTINPPRDYCFMSGQSDTNIQITNNTTGVDDSAGALIQQDGNDLYIWNKENSFMSLGTNATERLRIDSNGNVNFGAVKAVALPSGTGIQVYNSSSPRIKLVNDTTGNASGDGSYLYVSGSDFIIENKENANLRLYTNATERLRITSAGLVRVPDNGKFTAGAGDDLEIYHDGTDNFIKSNTALKIQAAGSNSYTIHVSARTDKETIICYNNTNAPYVELYYNNSKKFETTSAGVTVTGTVSDSLGPVRRLPTNTQSGNYTLVASDLGKMVVRTGGNITISDIGTAAAGDMITIMNNASSSMTIISSSFTLYNTADGATTSPKTLAARGVATLVFIATNVAYISGGGIS